MTSPNPGAKSSSNGALIWIGVGVVVVILGVVAVFLASGKGGGKEKVENQTGSVSVGGSTSTTADIGSGGDGAAPAGSLPTYDATLDTDPAVGMTIPTVTGQDFDGNDITISGDDGQAKVILFAAHWCPHCQREVPLLKAHLDDVPMPDDVELLTVSTSVQPGATNYPPQKWLEKEGWSAPVLADDEDSTVAREFGLSSFPYFVVVDKDGKVVERTSGEISTEKFDALVKAAQDGSA